jgi:hypothetical protein
MKASGLALLTVLTAHASPLLTITDQRLHPLPAALFGQFLERPSWGGEYGPEAVCDTTGQLSPAVETALAGLHAPLVRFPVGTDGDYIDWQDLIDLSGRARSPITVGHKGDSITNRFGLPEYFALAARQGWQTLLVANLRDALYRKKPLPEAAAHAAALLRYGLDHSPAGSIAAFQIGNEGWFFWPPAKPEDRAALGLTDDAEAARWLRECLVAYADVAHAVSPAIPLICDAPRPLDGGGLENNAAAVWRAAIDHPDIRSRYQMLAAHAYAPMGLWHTERAGQKIASADLSPDEIWLAALATLGRFDAAGQCVADRSAFDAIAALGFRAAVTEWNWNGWDWQKKFPHAGFGDGLPAALGAAGFLHGLIRSPHVTLATQSMMLGTTWGITGVRVAPDGTVGYLPQAEAVRLHAAHHGTHVVTSQLTDVPDLGPAPRLTTWWPAADHVAQIDAVVTADARAWYVHLLHRHRTEAATLTLRLPASARPSGDATLHLLTGESASTTHQPGGLTRTESPAPYEHATLTVVLAPAAIAVLVIPRL